MDANGVVTAVDVVDPGSGYTTAPTVTIIDASQVNPTAATVDGDHRHHRRSTSPPAAPGYDSAPTVTITDTVGAADKGASATATVAVKGPSPASP